MPAPRIYLEVEPRTLEDEIVMIESFESEGADPSYILGVKHALEWLLYGDSPPSQLAANSCPTVHVHSNGH
jgi:hypothetical protein